MLAEIRSARRATTSSTPRSSCAPTNPTRPGRALVLQFRAARRFGYGVSPGMARRCLERLDEEEVGGELRVLRVLSDTDGVATQGPVWRVGGKSGLVPDLVSWMVIEQRLAVVDSKGDDVGRIDEVLGEEEADIFNGLNILTGAIGTKTYVPAEAVGEIVEDAFSSR